MAILGAYPDAPEELLISREVDTYPAAVPERADLIDGREKDLDYVGILLQQGLVDEDEIRSLLQELSQDQVDRVESLLKRLRRV